MAEVLAATGDGHSLPRRTRQRWRVEGNALNRYRLPSGQLRIHRSEFDAWTSRLRDDKE